MRRCCFWTAKPIWTILEPFRFVLRPNIFILAPGKSLIIFARSESVKSKQSYTQLTSITRKSTITNTKIPAKIRQGCRQHQPIASLKNILFHMNMNKAFSKTLRRSQGLRVNHSLILTNLILAVDVAWAYK